MFASDMFLADRPLHDKSPYPLSRIQQLELREQVHQTVAGRRARRPHTKQERRNGVSDYEFECMTPMEYRSAAAA